LGLLEALLSEWHQAQGVGRSDLLPDFRRQLQPLQILKRFIVKAVPAEKQLILELDGELPAPPLRGNLRECPLEIPGVVAIVGVVDTSRAGLFPTKCLVWCISQAECVLRLGLLFVQKIDTEVLVTRILAYFSVALALALLVGDPGRGWALEEKLSVRETAGVGRRGGTVTSGLPFARGVIKDVQRLSVSVGGKVIPAQFLVLARWDDGSVRWALLDCQVDVGAGAATSLVLRDDGKNRAPASPVMVKAAGKVFRISTGSLSLLTGSAEGGLFKSVKIDGRELLTSAGRGLVIRKAGGGECVAGAPEEVKIEQAGPMRSTVMLRGKFPGIHNGLLGYTVRITVFAGQKFVKVRVWLENRGAYGYAASRKAKPRPQWLAFDGLSMEMGLGLGQELTAECQGVSAAGKFKVLQYCKPTAPGSSQGTRSSSFKDFEYRITGGKGDGQLKKGQRTDGVVVLRGKSGGLTAAVRHFWQNYEKAVELDQGKLQIWLWPSEGQYPRATGVSKRDPLKSMVRKGLYQLPGSVHKGHEVILDFSGRTPQETSAELSQSLFSFASAAYYASTDAAPGIFAPPGVSTGDGDCDQKFTAWLKMARSSVKAENNSGLIHARRTSRHGFWYGWMDFGDLFLPGSAAVSLHYDWPWIMAINAMRNGDPALMRMTDEMVRHRIEIDQQWSDSEAVPEDFRGMQRAAGGSAHFHGGGFSRNPPDIGSTWLPGVVLYHMLTGDLKARECAVRGSEAVLRFWKTAPKSKSWYTRRKMGNMQICARSIFTFCAMNDLTADKKWLENALDIFRKRVVSKWKWCGSHLHDVQQIQSQSYTRDDIRYCYSIQALCLLHHRTGDKHLFELLKVGCDREFPDNFFDAPLFLADLYGYVALKTGNTDYGEDGAELWLEASPESKCPPVYTPDNTKWTERSAMYLRAGHVLQYYFWKQGLKQLPAYKPVKKPVVPPAVFPEGGQLLVLEIESFERQRADICLLKGASGGKAVAFGYLDGRATRKVKLPAGDYEIVAWVYAPDREADAFFIGLGPTTARVYAGEHKEISKASKMTLTIKTKGVYDLSVQPAEINFQLDKIEITKLK
jgi:PcRGLX-like N-terminal RIFT barrel domain/PcRGLX-like protein central beta sandwich domain